MPQLTEGLYRMEEQANNMPCSLSDLRRRIAPYVAPNALGKAEDEEAAVRVVYPSIVHDEWLGITWKKLMRNMCEEANLDQAISSAQIHNASERWMLRGRREKYYLLCTLTLGIYALFVPKPKPNFVNVPEHDLPITCVPIYGPKCIFDAIHRLLKRGLLKIEKSGELEIIFPTPQLVKMLM